MTSDSAFWTKIARKYAKDPIADMAAYEKTLEVTKSYLKPTDQVLEIGRGTGSTAISLAPMVAQYTATDFSNGMIEIAEERQAEAGLTNMTCRVASSDTAAQDQTFDVVLALNLLHLIEDVDASLGDVSKALKPQGTFISKTVTTPKGAMPLKIKLMLWALPIAQWLGKAPFVRFDDPQDLEKRIVAQAFEIFETKSDTGVPPRHYIVARKIR